MTIVFILFFGSLLLMSIMIGKKMFALRGIENNKEAHEILKNMDVPDLEDIKYAALKRLKGFGYSALVTSIRLYVLSSHLIKRTGKELYKVAKDKMTKKVKGPEGEVMEPREVSKFLKKVSEYKDKIKNIKHRIKKEENIN